MNREQLEDLLRLGGPLPEGEVTVSRRMLFNLYKLVREAQKKSDILDRYHPAQVAGWLTTIESLLVEE